MENDIDLESTTTARLRAALTSPHGVPDVYLGLSIASSGLCDALRESYLARTQEGEITTMGKPQSIREQVAEKVNKNPFPPGQVMAMVGDYGSEQGMSDVGYSPSRNHEQLPAGPYVVFDKDAEPISAIVVWTDNRDFFFDGAKNQNEAGLIYIVDPESCQLEQIAFVNKGDIRNGLKLIGWIERLSKTDPKLYWWYNDLKNKIKNQARECMSNYRQQVDERIQEKVTKYHV